MKILVFSPYYPPHVGGLETHSLEFNKYLKNKGNDITVFTPDLPSVEQTDIIRYPAWEIVTNYPLPKFWSLRFWKLFLGLFKKDFDLVISRTRFFNTSLIALFYSKLTRTKWVHIEHGSDYVTVSSRLTSFLSRLYDEIFGRAVFKFSTLNISISGAVQKFVYKFNKRPSPIIYRGLEFSRYDQVQPQEKSDKIRVCWAGRMYKWKGVDKTIEAYDLLPEEIKNKIELVLIGDGEDRARLEEKANKNIIFTGLVTEEEVVSWLKSADIYLHTSFHGGGLSTSLLQGMYCENAIISSPYEGANEVINDKTGLLIDLKAEEIKDNLIRLVNNEELRTDLARKAKQEVFEKFKWENSIEKYIKIFEDLCAE